MMDVKLVNLKGENEQARPQDRREGANPPFGMDINITRRSRSQVRGSRSASTACFRLNVYRHMQPGQLERASSDAMNVPCSRSPSGCPARAR